jgi:histidyl-tRNA synthetase
VVLVSPRFQAPKGTRDLLPPATAVWAAVEDTARRVFARYGFHEIRTPIFEDTELFVRGVGASSDVVGKEMYTFEDKGGRSLTLRPESTAPVVRAYVEHGMRSWPQPVKLYYIGPQFRHERPQKGRYREFRQIGVELLGKAGPEADVEVILVLVRFLTELGLEPEVRLNTVGDEASRTTFRAALVSHLRPVADRLSEDSRRRLDTNPLRILDTKSPEERELLRDAPRLDDHLSEESRRHFSAVQEHLRAFDVRFTIDPTLVRGLDYYTHTVFEVSASGLGAQDAICGGGAYDQLVAELGGPPTYGVGFAIGQDRLVDVLPPGSAARRGTVAPVVVVALKTIPGKEGDRGVSPVFALLEQMRREGIAAIEGPSRKERLFEFAEREGAPAIVFLAEDELARGEISVREMATRITHTMARERLFPDLKSSSFLPSSPLEVKR